MITIEKRQHFTSEDFVIEALDARPIETTTHSTTELLITDWITKFIPDPQYRLGPDDMTLSEQEVSTLRHEDWDDEGMNNCLDFACTLIDQLEKEGVDTSQYRVVILENAKDPTQPGHVGLLSADGKTFYDQAGPHDWSEYQDDHPDLAIRTNDQGELPRADQFLEVMSLAAGSERDQALAAAGLAKIADEPLALAPIVLLGLGLLIAAVLAGCSTEPTPSGPPVFDTPEQLHAALAKNQNLAGATFNFHVGYEFNLNDRDLTGARFMQGCDADLIAATLVGAEFHGTTSSNFHGADLTRAKFFDKVEYAAFLYANLNRANFSEARLTNVDFAFAENIDRAGLSTSMIDCVFTGTRYGADLMLGPVLLNDPSTIHALGGETKIRELKANGELLPALARVLPPGSLDGMLPPSWRSAIYDELRLDHDELSNQAKSRIFDAVDGRYGPYDRPENGPTLFWLYENEPRFRSYIDATLANLLLSEEPSYLNDPFQSSASPYNFQFVQRTMRGAADLNAWLTSQPAPINWNGQEYDVRDVLLTADLIQLLRERIGGESFARISADGLVSLRDLIDAGLTDHAEALITWSR